MGERGQRSTAQRIGGYLHRVVPIANSTGNIISDAFRSLVVKFHPTISRR